MEDEFDILAAKVLAGEATQEERTQLQAMLARNDELRSEFAALQSTWNSLKEAAPVIQAQNAPPAPIPAGRLRQLQQAVRDSHLASSSTQSEEARPHHPSEQNIRSAKPRDWRSLLECARPLALWLARLGNRNRQSASALRDAHAPVSSWSQRWNGAVPGMVFAALVLLITGTFIWINWPETPRSSVGGATDAVAHLLVTQGRAEVHRDGQILPVTSAFTLRPGDKVQLPSGSEATVIAPGGDVQLRGPKTTTTGELTAEARYSSRLTSQTDQVSSLQFALFRPVPELLKAGLLVTTRSAQSIPLYSPNGATASLTPLILWKAEPGKTYDLQITDEFNSATPPWTLRAATSPVDFAKVEAWRGRALARDGLYRMRISETGQRLSACEYTFQTVQDPLNVPPHPGVNPLQEVLQILTTAPSRAGDALAILLTLPPHLAESELSLRLKLMVFGQLGQQADFEAATARLRSSK